MYGARKSFQSGQINVFAGKCVFDLTSEIVYESYIFQFTYILNQRDSSFT